MDATHCVGSRRHFLGAAVAAGAGLALDARPDIGPAGEARLHMDTKTHEADVCVVGGGMAGLCAALAAARHGARVVLMHDRPVLGGNASSEVRMHICGADRHNEIKNLRETGLLEEIRLENLARNPNRNYSIWDTVLYEKAWFQKGLQVLLNCTCQSVRMDGDRLASVTGWQLTTETTHTVEASIFIDASGDGLLAPLSGAPFRIGREARGEFGESLSREVADSKTMGMTCLFQARPYPKPQPFKALPWAYTFERDEQLPYGAPGHREFGMGYWWIEVGGEQNSIADAEAIRHELLRIVYGVWDHIKNRGDHGAENWALEWVQFLPGKRESRRYIGDHVLSQADIDAAGRFPDTVAYGGWPMDDHDPAGFWAVKSARPSTTFHPAPSPYGIPYRSLYSKKVRNLMCAGRCASATHLAMSSTRVMGTCSVMGQAAGTAAAMASARSAGPRDVGDRVRELQQTLLRDDAYLPWVPMEFRPAVKEARLTATRGNPEPVRDGVNRPVKDDPHAWTARPGDSVACEFARPARVETVTLVLDSALDRNIQMSLHGDFGQLGSLPPSMPKAFRIEGLADGQWRTIRRVEDNYQRLVRLPVGESLAGVRFTLDGTWGAPESKVFAFYVE
jgi:hypothetical protein